VNIIFYHNFIFVSIYKKLHKNLKNLFLKLYVKCLIYVYITLMYIEWSDSIVKITLNCPQSQMVFRINVKIIKSKVLNTKIKWDGLFEINSFILTACCFNLFHTFILIQFVIFCTKHCSNIIYVIFIITLNPFINSEWSDECIGFVIKCIWM